LSYQYQLEVRKVHLKTLGFGQWVIKIFYGIVLPSPHNFNSILWIHSLGNCDLLHTAKSFRNLEWTGKGAWDYNTWYKEESLGVWKSMRNTWDVGHSMLVLRCKFPCSLILWHFGFLNSVIIIRWKDHMKIHYDIQLVFLVAIRFLYTQVFVFLQCYSNADFENTFIFRYIFFYWNRCK